MKNDIVKQAIDFFEQESQKSAQEVVNQVKEYGAIKVLSSDKTQLVFQVIDEALIPIRLRGKNINKKYNSVKR